MKGELTRSRLREFLRRHNTISLATVGSDGRPHAAAVFYALDRKWNLYYLSSPSCRHSQNLRQDPRVAATIQADGQAWQSIQGVQVEGTVEAVTGTGPAAEAVRVYVGRFEFLRGLWGVASGLSDLVVAEKMEPLREALASSRFYVLRPTWFRLIDNTLGFGHREEIVAEELLRET
jgi:uncharacterized protein YhbP (UPF0306 family)